MVLDDTLTLRDEGLSAYHQRHITNGALGVFLRAVEDGHVSPGSVLIVEGLDRLSRAEPIQAQAQLAQIVNAGITVVTASDGREYNRERLRAQPMDLVYSLLVMIRAHEESDTKSKRVKAAIRRQCQGWIAGHWRKPIRVGRDPQWVREVDGKFELIPERADAVRFLIEKYLAGYGSERTIRELEKLGISISDAGKTCAPHLYKLFANRGLIGEKVCEIDGEEFRLEGYYPAVVSPEKFAEIRYVAEQRKGRKGKGRPGQGEIPGIVTGIAITYCGYCGTTVLAQNLMGRKRDDQGRPQPGHRRLVCHAYRSVRGCPVRGTVMALPVERALMHYCSDQINLSRLLEGDSGAAAISAQIAKAKMRAVEAEAQIERATNALLLDTNAPPAALLKRLRQLEEQLGHNKHEIDVLEHKLAAESAAPPAAAQAWAELVKGVEDLDYDARIKARQLVADTFSRIVIYHKGFNPQARDKTIGVLLVAKRGTTRMIHVDRKTGEWRAAEEIDLSPNEIPLPSLRMVS
jgi:DNA invertase Pin-like site-specific DNA recombinase